MASTLGEFALKLGIKTDRDAFEQSSRSVDKLTNNINRLVGALKVAAVFKGIEMLTGVESASLRTAYALGISTKSLDTWKAAAKIAGINANGLVQSMTSLENKFNQIKVGIAPDQGLAQAFSFLKLNYNELADMDADDRLKKIYQAAQAEEDREKALAALNQIVGGEGAEFFKQLQVRNITIDEALAEAEKKVFTTESSKYKALGFTTELNGIVASIESLTKLTGSEVADSLTPFLKGINGFFSDHGDEIAKKITNFAGALSTISAKLAPGLWTGAETAVKMIGDLTNAITALLTGDWDKVNEGLGKFFDDFYQGMRKLMHSDEVGEVMSNTYSDARAAGSNPISATLKSWDEGAKASWFGGIYKMMKGLLTPDDFLGLETVAAGLAPINYAPTQNEVSITQNFTINGGTKTLPQTIKESAFNGAQSGVNFAHQSAQRQQQMPGTR